MMKSVVEKLKRREDLTRREVEEAMQAIMSGKTPTGDIVEFLSALREKGATIEEITGAAVLMRRFYLPVKTRHAVVLDTCGTGGDKKHTFNISTVVALVVAGAGVAVAKHGNRSVSSKCGSADVLEALGVKLDIGQAQINACLDETGLAFLFAQKLHPAMKNVAPARKALGVETIFNILGPLANPAQATHQIIGIYNRDLVEPVAHVLKNLGLKRGLVVHGSDGLDEITTTGKTYVSEFNGREVLSYHVSPEEVGLRLARGSDLTGGDVRENARIVLDILQGKTGAKRDIVVLNAAYALYAAEKVTKVSDGIAAACESIDTGQAMAKLEALKELTHRPAGA